MVSNRDGSISKLCKWGNQGRVETTTKNKELRTKNKDKELRNQDQNQAKDPNSQENLFGAFLHLKTRVVPQILEGADHS